ncbi:MAG TPA: DNA methyltransferase [Sphingobium sp.]|uniref:DNA methyltransferase n=1 Tax=Sphingobium sp. TaxID=1912891 RepID=UPI002ED2309D
MTAPTDYRAFLEAKIPMAQKAGLPCSLDDIPTHLLDGRPIKDHQRHIVRWAVEGGRRALFEAFGLGKTLQQLLILDIILRQLTESLGPAMAPIGLIVAPLGVRMEFMKDAALLGIEVIFVQSDVEITAARDAWYWDTETDHSKSLIFLTNFESVREGKITVSRFAVASLDEASVLRSYGSKTYQEFLPLFAEVPYRFVATATPSPNRYKELIHYAGYLGIMDTGQALTRFFQRDPQQANNLKLYPHKEDEFWLWLNSWAVFLQTPSDLGFSDEGYVLPPLTVNWHKVQADIAGDSTESNGQMRLVRDTALGVVQASREKRRTLDSRVERAAEIMAVAPDDHFVVWHDLEDERRAIEALRLPGREDGIASVYGSQDLDTREKIIGDFADGRIKDLAAKPVMLGSGTNLQRHCHRAIFAGIGHKFNDFIQAIYRLQRFGQLHGVIIDAIYAETEEEVRRDLLEKWERDTALRARMSELIRSYGLQHDVAIGALHRSIGVERQEISGEGWTLALNDCVEEARLLEENSLDQIITSIPFSNHYEYTPSYNDFGHTDSDEHFFAQMDFLTPELLRALKPGRLACIHVKDRILFGSVTGEGVPTVNPFHAKTLFHYQQHGFQYLGMIHVNTDVVRENNQTYRLSYSEMLKDGTKMGVGSPEYVLLMRKPQTDRSRGYADEPVTKVADDYSLARWQIDAHSFYRSSGDSLLLPAELETIRARGNRFAAMDVGMLVKTFMTESRGLIYDHEALISVGEEIEARDPNDGRGHLPRTFMSLAPGSTDPNTWDDVVRMRTLNAEQVQKGREKHVCPLQFDIVDRLIDRFSNKGDLIYDPFCGLGTVPMRAILKGRRGRGSELNPDYWRHSATYLGEAEAQRAVPTLFDLLDGRVAA